MYISGFGEDTAAREKKNCFLVNEKIVVRQDCHPRWGWALELIKSRFLGVFFDPTTERDILSSLKIKNEKKCDVWSACSDN